MSKKNKNISINRNRLPMFTAIFFVSLSLFIYQTLLTRLFSAVLNYNFVFVVVSFAILGSGLGGILNHKLTMKKGMNNEKLLFACSMGLSGSIIISIALMYFIPFRPLFVLFILTSMIPFIMGGMIISAAFKENSEISNKLYFMDLSGGGIGSLAVIKIMDNYGFISSVVIVEIFSILALISIDIYFKKTRRVLTAGLTIILLTVSLVNKDIIMWLEGNFYSYYTNPSTAINLLQNSDEKPLRIPFTKWNSIAKTDVIETSNENEKIILMDGGAAAPIIRFNGDINEVQYLKKEVNYIPFSFGNNKDTLVIGSGGGKDVLFALLGGSKRIDAVEINKSSIDAVNHFKDFSGDIYKRPEVKVHAQDGRNFVENSSDKYDNIYLSMVMTNTAENTMYSLSENYIYTYEAFDSYLNHLKDDGKLSFMVHDENDLTRIANTGIKVLMDRGVSQEKVTDYFVIVNGVTEEEKDIHGTMISMPLVIFKSTPFKQDELNSIKEISKGQGREILVAQGKNETIYKALAENKISLNQLISSIPFNSKPTTDDSPFFYNYSKFLPMQMVFIFLIVLLVCIYIVQKYSQKKQYNEPIKYFAGLGLAYMLVEIPIIQKMVLYFGTPSLAFSFILFSILISSGIGSALSGTRLAEKYLLKTPFFLLIAGASIIISQLTIVNMLGIANNLSIGYKLIVTFIATFPMGMLMGIPFPIGIKRLNDLYKNENVIALMWGVNGIFSVLGSILAVIISIKFGFSTAFNLGAIIYICLYFINPLKIGKA